MNALLCVLQIIYTMVGLAIIISPLIATCQEWTGINSLWFWVLTWFLACWLRKVEMTTVHCLQIFVNGVIAAIYVIQWSCDGGIPNMSWSTAFNDSSLGLARLSLPSPYSGILAIVILYNHKWYILQHIGQNHALLAGLYLAGAVVSFMINIFFANLALHFQTHTHDNANFPSEILCGTLTGCLMLSTLCFFMEGVNQVIVKTVKDVKPALEPNSEYWDSYYQNYLFWSAIAFCLGLLILANIIEQPTMWTVQELCQVTNACLVGLLILFPDRLSKEKVKNVIDSVIILVIATVFSDYLSHGYFCGFLMNDDWSPLLWNCALGMVSLYAVI